MLQAPKRKASYCKDVSMILPLVCRRYWCIMLLYLAWCFLSVCLCVSLSLSLSLSLCVSGSFSLCLSLCVSLPFLTTNSLAPPPRPRGRCHHPTLLGLTTISSQYHSSTKYLQQQRRRQQQNRTVPETVRLQE